MQSTFRTISVIVPSFNRRELLSRALRSVVKQVCDAQVELIVVDDGSTDGSADMVAADFPTARLICQENKGVSAARNAGIQMATGQWIAFLDSDDRWMEQKLQRQIEALVASPDYRLCHTEEIWIRNGVRVNAMKKHQKGGGWIYERCLKLCCISPSSVLLRRDVFDEVGFFDEDLPACEDYDLWLRICARHPVLYLEEALIWKYGGHEDQLSRKHWGMDRFRIYALEKMLESDVLGPVQRASTLAILIRKLEILINGAKKRDNQEVVTGFSPRLERARRQSEVGA